MKNKKIILYDPYLDTLGGGEKYILSILKILEESKKAQTNICWYDIGGKIQRNLNVDFSKANFINSLSQKSFLKKVFLLKDYDYFLYVTDGSYFFSTAKKNFVYAMVPDKKLYQMSLLNKLKLYNYKFITHSKFVKKKLKEWHIYAELIYPYIDSNFIKHNFYRYKKDKIILSVGRFFKHLHSKRQDICIETFKKLKQSHIMFKDFKLILAGRVKEEDCGYFDELQKIAHNDPSIIFKPNASYQELVDIYKKATIYWHFAGYGNDENTNPEKVEHLGISPLEAMASGCLTFCYQAGGPKELITDGVNGFLFISDNQLISKTVAVMKNNRISDKIIVNGKKFVTDNFNYNIFKKRVWEVFS